MRNEEVGRDLIMGLVMPALGSWDNRKLPQDLVTSEDKKRICASEMSLCLLCGKWTVVIKMKVIRPIKRLLLCSR